MQCFATLRHHCSWKQLKCHTVWLLSIHLPLIKVLHVLTSSSLGLTQHTGSKLGSRTQGSIWTQTAFLNCCRPPPAPLPDSPQTELGSSLHPENEKPSLYSTAHQDLTGASVRMSRKLHSRACFCSNRGSSRAGAQTTSFSSPSANWTESAYVDNPCTPVEGCSAFGRYPSQWSESKYLGLYCSNQK